MTRFFKQRMQCVSHRSVATISLTCALMGNVTACHGLLDATNPLLIRNEDVTNPSGAEGRRAALVLAWQAGFVENTRQSTLLSDEQTYDIESLSNYGNDRDWVIDARDTAGMQATMMESDRTLNDLTSGFWKSTLAIHALRAYGDPALKDDYLTQAFALRGHLALLMAETVCAGFPMTDVDPDNRPIYGTPLTTDSALKYAIAQFDSALVHGKDSAQFINLARVLKGRALLDLGQYAAAATAVDDVPDDFVYNPELIDLRNPFFFEVRFRSQSFETYFMGDGEGGNGLHFVSEHDVIRLPTLYGRQRLSASSDSLFAQNIYQGEKDPISVATGREARLIQMEAAYQANDPSWFDQLNAMRTEVGLDAIPTMPATTAEKVDLIFHERAFWLFRTGHRLGDMRRLISRYGRDPETVFPTGDYPIFGLQYGNATSLHYSTAVQMTNNPNITQGCPVP